jgi:hypothetical protein
MKTFSSMEKILDSSLIAMLIVKDRGIECFGKLFFYQLLFINYLILSSSPHLVSFLLRRIRLKTYGEVKGQMSTLLVQKQSGLNRKMFIFFLHETSLNTVGMFFDNEGRPTHRCFNRFFIAKCGLVNLLCHWINDKRKLL